MNEIKSLGEVAFEAYCTAVGGQTFDGKPIPGWDELHGDRLKVQGGWEAAAQAIRQHVTMMSALPTDGLSIRDLRERQQSRWQPIDFNPVNTLTDYGQEAPGGQGEAPIGRHVAVEVGPDDDRPVECEDPGCTRRDHL